MATSSKVRFDLATLKDQALESIDIRIQQAQVQVDSHHDSDALEALEREWRSRQEGKLLSLVERLDTVTNYQLSKFSIDEMPTGGNKYDQQRDRDRLDSLLRRRGEITAKATSLVAEEDGSISLTKTQLREFFDL